MSEHPEGSLVPTHPDRAALALEGAGSVETAERAPEAGGGPPTLQALLGAWSRRWLRATFLGLVLAAAAAPAVWYLMPVKYTVFTLLRVASQEPTVLPADRSGAPGDPGGVYRQTQVALVTSRPTILSALRQERVRNLSIIAQQEDPAAWFEKNLQAGFLENTELLRIAMTGDRPDELSVLVSAIEQTYLQEVVKAEQRQRLLRLDEIQKILVASEERLRTQREKLRRLAESLKTTDTQSLTLRQRIILEECAALTRELLEVQAKRRQLANFIAVQEPRTKDMAKLTFPDSQVNKFLSEDPQVQRAMEKVHLMEYVLELDKEVGVPGSKRLTSAQAEVEKARKGLEKVRAMRRPAAIERLQGEAFAQLRGKIDESKEQLAVLESQEAGLKGEINRRQKEADSIGITSIELDMKRGEIEQADQVIKTLRAEKERLEVEIQSSARRVTPLSADGEIYQVKNTKSRAAAAALGGGLAFLLGGLLVAGWEYSRRRIHTPDEVIRGLGLKVLGALPGVPASSLQRQGAGGRNRLLQGIWEESLCGLRTALFLSGNGPPAILMITSAGAREGKTTLAAHLAVSIAATGRRTLLVDCDLRRPVLHRVFEAADSPGLCEVLRGEAEVAAAIQPTRMGNLFLLPAGQVCRDALTCLAREHARGLFETLKGQFDCILIDTSPVLPVTDALLIGQHADGVLIAVRSNVSRVPRVRAAHERLKALNKRFVAAVVSGTREPVDASEYHRYLTPV